jgi:hypothetical protein
MNIRQLVGWTLVVDSAIGLMLPSRYLRMLEVGPRPLRRLLEGFASHPDLTRVACVAEMAAGAMLVRASSH